MGVSSSHEEVLHPGGTTESTPLRAANNSAGTSARRRWAKVRVYVSTSHEFRKLIKKPARPPLPGSATPAGYVIHKRPPPKTATWSDRTRDWFLDLATHDIVTYVLIVWALLLLADAIVFFGCLFYWFGWGTAVMYDDRFCNELTGADMPSANFQCNLTTGALTYSIEDFWQERTAAWMSWLFLYAIAFATPWRLSILFQLWERRCAGKDGVDFYGRPSDFNFFHIPRSGRCAISILLTGNVVLQLVQSALYIYPWNNVFDYIKQPNGTILLVTGPLQGCLLGGGAAVVQIYWEAKLHASDPKRFPPAIPNTIWHIWQLRKQGVPWQDILRSLGQRQDRS